MNMSLKNGSMLFGVLVAGALAGCVSQPVEQKPAGPDQIDVKVSDAMASIASSMHLLAQVEQSSRQAYVVPDAKTAVPPGMEQKVDVDWVGPIEGLVGQMARRAGYEFKTVGHALATPIMVTVRGSGVSIYEVLIDAGHQAGAAADVNVRSGTKTVELVFGNK